MPVSSRSFSFDARSVMLFAALTAGSAAALQAQTTLPEPSTAVAGNEGAGSANAHAAASHSLHRAFQRADTDQDGRLSPTEAARLPAIANRFSQLDRDGDGYLSRAEFDAGARL